ncbi:unnamed protein product [Oppiella nova]|uniref:Choline kinase n=1 Tax=Oppiella nova TaxID=334625 RepID=A0A7R9M549_9ACAR|nr:unnamed protein product [Oppiella nova]CAG2170829.1 unnamed protein product [Oppiella nova]
MDKVVSVGNRHKIYELCKTLLSGKWAQINESELIIKSNTDGFTNQLFYCFLPEKHNKTKYNKIVVRMQDANEYQEYFNPTHVLSMGLLLSAKGLAPKILGVFDSGIISEFIDGRYFSASDDHNPRAVELIAQNVAKLHSSEMPIPKDSTQQLMTNVFEVWFDEKLMKSIREGLVYDMIQKHKYETFLALDLLDEMSWLRQTIQELNSPVVFSHNDFNRKNILIRETNDKNSQNLDLFFIDFDFSSYAYRGIDLGYYFSSWGQKETQFGYGVFPTDSQMLPFINAYIEEMTTIYGNSYVENEMNSRERLIFEAKVFALYAFMVDLLFCIYLADSNKKPDEMINAEKSYGSKRVSAKDIGFYCYDMFLMNNTEFKEYVVDKNKDKPQEYTYLISKSTQSICI